MRKPALQKDKQTSRQDGDETQYRQLLEKYKKIIEHDRENSKPQYYVIQLITWLLSSRLPSINISNLKTIGEFMDPALKLAKLVPGVSFAILVGLASATGATWAWWFLRRHCIWVICHLLFPLLMNSLLAFIPTSLSSIDEAQWRTSLSLTFLFAGAWLVMKSYVWRYRRNERLRAWGS